MSINPLEPDWARPANRIRPVSRAHIAHFPRRREYAAPTPPRGYVSARVNGREDSYFEWLGAGFYSPMQGRASVLQDLRYGFDEGFFYLRVDPGPDAYSTMRDAEFQITLRSRETLRLVVAIEAGRCTGSLLDAEDFCILGQHEFLTTAFEEILEVAMGRRLFHLAGCELLTLNVGLWRDGALVGSLPAEGSIHVALGADAFAWSAE